MRFVFGLVVCFFSCCISKAASEINFSGAAFTINGTEQLFSEDSLIHLVEQLSADTTPTAVKENKRLIAFITTLLLGPFGAHRIYLGTKHTIPIAYVLTLGGGLGIIPVIDAFIILFTKDFEKLQNNNRFFMWTKE